jgi:hypothetical protein
VTTGGLPTRLPAPAQPLSCRMTAVLRSNGQEASMSEVRPGDALVGAWRLVSWENHAADGQVTYPMGRTLLAT